MSMRKLVDVKKQVGCYLSAHALRTTFDIAKVQLGFMSALQTAALTKTKRKMNYGQQLVGAPDRIVRVSQ